MSLSAFFAQNAAVADPESFVVSTRFKDPKGNPLPWKLRAMTEAENAEIRKSATKINKGKGGIRTPEVDSSDYIAKLTVASVVFPNLKDEELQVSYGVRGADNLIRKMLMPGEYAELVNKVQEINGFDREMTDLIEEAKN